jgi:hypothetical protein
VVRGFEQVPGRDFMDIYAATARPVSFKVFIAAAAARNWLVHHVDVVAAFLNTDLKEAIQIELPEIVRDQHPGQVGLLMRSLYGLRQAPLEWYNTLRDALTSLGFTRTESDHSVFTHHARKIHVLVHVDDMLLLCPVLATIKWLKAELSKSFLLTDNGFVERFLGIDVVRSGHDIFLSQQAYVDKILTRFGLDDANPVPTPFFDKDVLKPNEEQATAPVIKLYQEHVGALVWLVVSTRPDIAWAVCKLARYSHNPSSAHFRAVKRVFRYLKGTKELCLRFTAFPECGQALHLYVDADWASPHGDDRFSTSGYVFILAGSPIAWQSKRQTLVSLSTTEAEYVAACIAAQDLVWIHRLLSELNLIDLMPKPTIMYEDNQGAIRLGSNDQFHPRSKHIDVKYHFVRQQIDRGECIFHHVSTNDQIADGLTKPLDIVKHRRFIDQMGLTASPKPLASSSTDTGP